MYLSGSEMQIFQLHLLGLEAVASLQAASKVESYHEVGEMNSQVIVVFVEEVLDGAVQGSMLELRLCWMRMTGIHPSQPAEPQRRGHRGVDRSALGLVRQAPPNGLLQAGDGHSADRSTLRRADQGDDRGGALLR